MSVSSEVEFPRCDRRCGHRPVCAAPTACAGLGQREVVDSRVSIKSYIANYFCLGHAVAGTSPVRRDDSKTGGREVSSESQLRKLRHKWRR